VISTGSLPAVPFFLAGAMLRLDLHYIESATRSLGPSLTGKLASMIPGTNLYTQYASQASGRWNFAGSVFDPYRVELSTSVAASVSRVVVTLGTEAYPFSRAVMQLLKVLPSTAEVLWQTGSTDVSGMGIVGHRRIPANALRTAMAEADVIVSHAGVGSSITAMDLGKVPVLLPREGRHGEHVDDHQLQVARELSRRGLAEVARVEELSEKHLVSAMSRTVVRDEVLVPFPMVGVNPMPVVSSAQPVPIQPLNQR
jgi:UDP-N-acetylglucosamine transferase subunit ALG13